MWYFRITEANADFAALLNDGVRPSVLDEEGDIQFFVVYADDRPNEIHSGVAAPKHISYTGTRINFAEA
jgi:hypothetical protein